MAFFEELGKKVSQTSQDAVKKTKIMAETSKLHSQISAEKRNITDIFSQLGEKYFGLFSENPDENLAPFILAIKAAYQKIDAYEDQINKLKGIGTCPGCGMELKEGVSFCSNCGTKIEQPAQETEATPAVPRVCASCGTPLAEGVLFCSNCGART